MPDTIIKGKNMECEYYGKHVKSKSIRHFTNVDALFKILKNGFRFSMPSDKWEDKNDAYCVTQYAQLTNQDVYVLCFCNGIGNAHHWTAFGHNGSAACKDCYKNIPCNIKINREIFENALQKKGLTLQEVIYVTSAHIQEKFINIEDLPRLKRAEYWVEQEERVIVRVNKGSSNPDNFKIPNDAIEGINILFQDEQIFGKIKAQLKDIESLKNVIIDFNGIQDSDQWKNRVSNQLSQLLKPQKI